MSKNEGTNADRIEEEILATPDKVFINIDTTNEEVVRCIKNKKFLIFEHEKGRFKVLSKEILELLDPITRGSYRASEALNAHHSPEADDLAKHLTVLQGPAPSAPRDKFSVETKENLANTWIRPDMLEEMKSKGWRVPTKDEIKHHNGREIEGHIEQKTGMGITDTVLMVKDAEAVRADHIRKDEARKAIGASMDIDAKEKILSTGYKPVEV